MSTPIRNSRSRLIAASREDVWKTLAAFDQIARWAKNVDHAEYTTTATEGVGATRRVRSGRVVVVESIIEWMPPARLAYTIEGLPLRVRQVTNGWQLEPTEGGTLATITTTIDSGERFGGKVAAAILSRVIGRVVEQLLASLAKHHAANRA